MSISFGGGGTLPADDPVIVALDVEAVGPAVALTAGAMVYLTHAVMVMDLEPGGLRILCPSPGEGSAYISLFADGAMMTADPLDLTGPTRVVPPAEILPGYRTLVPGTRLDVRVESLSAGYAVWRGLRVVLLAEAQLPGPVYLRDSAGNQVCDSDGSRVRVAVDF